MTGRIAGGFSLENLMRHSTASAAGQSERRRYLVFLAFFVAGYANILPKLPHGSLSILVRSTKFGDGSVMD